MNIVQHIFAFNDQSPLLFTQFYFWAFFAIVYTIMACILEFNPWHSKPNALQRPSNTRLHLRNLFLMFVSWFFYYKTSGIFLLILLFVTLSDWLIAKQIYRNKQLHQLSKAKAWLVLSIVIDLGMLCYFKYAYFFTNMVNDILGTDFAVFDIFAYIGNGLNHQGRFMVDTIVLPVGISFYIFQVISYTTDVYRGLITPLKNVFDFGFYVSFFPQLVAGPIVRANEFIPQLYRPFRLSKRLAGMALFWILNGLAKKILLSDYLAVNLIDRVFDNPLLFSGFENLFALFAYSLQVYADFSGYTDIAIGVAMLMGFYLPKNFNSPYKATNPQDFWHRWHMSLSRWLKSYLYIPLGGNRETTFGTYFWIILIALVAFILTGSWIVMGILSLIAVVVLIVIRCFPQRRKLLNGNLNSFITMLLGGLWHGASWNFMIWGGLNGIGMIVYKIWKQWGYNFQILLLTLLTIAMWILKATLHMPLTNVLWVWSLCLWIGMAIKYLYWWIERMGYIAITGTKRATIVHASSHIWAVLQTFVFITSTRLFFRSGSNLDPATANQEAWETAKNMVAQIGGAWNNSIILPFLWEYRNVVILFVLGMIIHWLPDKCKQAYRIRFASLPVWALVLICVGAIMIVYQFITADLQAFIYFQF